MTQTEILWELSAKMQLNGTTLTGRPGLHRHISPLVPQAGVPAGARHADRLSARMGGLELRLSQHSPPCSHQDADGNS